ncbi:TolC family protein [Nostocaceae cyanobacterium CENA369]|uniref:TolC family protein n=1 Tax=Dendronalium phyllosphericum CENA369 TaxID=1725256 RepID=A0A8J7I1J1_9NOST|nr:TolC family protein [Dendronalium phyllosphericum]MBH8571610.1 TolC family protein [Dendronalium phyllosphericum CENA369]
MKRQQLFHSFLPGVTVAVLTTQPALAKPMQVNSVQGISSFSILTSTDSQIVAGNIHTQLPNTTTKTLLSLVPNSGLQQLSIKNLSSKDDPVISPVNTGLSREQIPKKDDGRFLSLISALNSSQQPKQDTFTSNKKQRNLASSVQQSKKIVVPTFDSKNHSVRKATFSLSSLQQSAVPIKQPTTQLPIVLQTTLRKIGSAKLLEVENCSQEKGTSAALLLTAKACQHQNLSRQLVVENNTPTSDTTSTPAPAGSQLNPIQTETVTPVPTSPATTPTQPETVTPAPANPVVTPTQPGIVAPVPANRVQVPEKLNSNPNPLQFPTKPEEVTFQGTEPITLAQALELARRNNRDLQVSLLELQRSQAALREAQAALLPTVGISANITRSQDAATQLQLEQQEQQTGIPTPGDKPSTSFSGQAQLSYDLYTSGRRQASIRQAEEQVRFYELAVESQSEEIRLNVTTDYYNLQQTDEQVRIAQSAVENAQASLRDAQALERAGVGTRFDVLRSQVNLANSQQDLTNAISQQQIARRQLATRIGTAQSLNISAADPVQLAGLWNQTLEQSIILAFQNRPELQQQLAQRNINEQQRRQALANLGPQISLVASYNLLDQFNDNVNVTDGYSLAVRANLNLYDGGASRARAAQAKANIAIAETQFAEQRNQIRFQVEQAFSNQQSNLENVQTANTALEQAREALRLARLRFQAGVGTQTDVINSENDLTRAEGNRVTAILDYNRALAQLQRSVTSRALP